MRKYLYGLILSLGLVFGHCNACQAETLGIPCPALLLPLAPVAIAAVPLGLGLGLAAWAVALPVVTPIAIYKLCTDKDEEAEEDPIIRERKEREEKERKEREEKERKESEKKERLEKKRIAQTLGW